MDMMTVKQTANITGVSVRTLQFYDEIGLLKPASITDAGYRLYDKSSLQVLQQILFFKELDFTLKEIKAIMDSPGFDKVAAFEKQRELIQLKRDHLTSLLGLLDKLIKGEECMEFKEFDMSEYFRLLDDFRRTRTDEIVKQLGSLDSYDEMISGLKSKEQEIAEMAVQQYGSLENYTNAMEKNFSDFLTNGPSFSQQDALSLAARTDEITKRLTADLKMDPSSPQVQEIMKELITFTEECNKGMDMGENYWSAMADCYASTPAFVEATDKKYGEGASQFISLAIKAYLAGK